MATSQSIRNAGRIAYEQDQLNRKHARLATLTPGSAAHAQCMGSILKTERLLQQLSSVSEKLASKPAKEPKVPGKRGPKGPVGPRKGAFFSVEIGADETLDLAV